MASKNLRYATSVFILRRIYNKGLTPMFFKKKESIKSVPLEWHQSGQRRWEDFIKTCEKFDYIKIKDGCAVGYTKGESEGDLYGGTQLLVPFEMITMYIE